MSLTINELRGLMDSQGLKYWIDPERPALLFGATGLSGTYQLVVHLDSDGQFLQLRSVQYQSCKPDNPNLPALTRVLAVLNGRARFVKYAWDANDGEVIAYGDHWVMDGTVTTEQFRRMLGNYLPVIDQNYPRIRQAIETGEDPGDQELADVLRTLKSSGELDEALSDLLDKLVPGDDKKPPEDDAQPPREDQSPLKI